MKINKITKYIKLGLFSLGLLAISCTNDNTEDLLEDNSSQLVKKFFNNEAVEVVPLENGDYLMYGDIIVTDQQLTDTKIDINENPAPNENIEKLALTSGIRKWTNNTIVYIIDNNLSQSVRNELQISMDVWSNNTNIKFKELTNESNYITITSNGNNCNCGSATLGMNGSRGSINLGTASTAVVIIHEIGHTLGYIHEQTRSDRDNYVNILFENIQSDAESQFSKNTSSQNIGDFDILSTMMYDAYTFSKNGQPTITRIDGSTYPRREAKLSDGDISGTNQVYPEDDGGNDGDSDDNCNEIDEWSNGQSYTVGDKVTYNGYLYERDYTRWNLIGACGIMSTADICEGIAEYSRYENYSSGDQVTYNDYLYTLQSNGTWINEGTCGS